MYRRILGYRRRDSASQMYAFNCIDNFDALMRKNVHGFMQRLCKSNNALVNNVVTCVQYMNNSMWHKWLRVLHTHDISY